MNAPRNIFGKPSEDAVLHSDARARADAATGRTVPNAEVAAWLEKVGTPEEGPMPRRWLK
ncbi:Antitoxin RelB2 [Tsuneonella dongtanensis]|uniref:Antitoxin RelB2 n=1 Tax=Tsuneonella dongtanensis TaxID=692370 RepID=A0A1B2AFU6_9SPHN|nr:Antitoxin RelB2 [Tsuneonella dongtanensis]